MSTAFELREAGPDDLPDCQAVRHEVFVLGQGVPAAIEADGRDPLCAHLIARMHGAPVGTARLRTVHGEAKAERVAVLHHARGVGLGRALMLELERLAARAGHPTLVLHAQVPVVPFYERLGYRCDGPVFYEADIPHRAMSKDLSATPRG
jgi:predicted GNAT family N-acyltransferase